MLELVAVLAGVDGIDSALVPVDGAERSSSSVVGPVWAGGGELGGVKSAHRRPSWGPQRSEAVCGSST
jgi:hypothetical protein